MDKPIIKHCANCKYSKYSVKKDYWGSEAYYYCDVRYKNISFPRIKALFCKYYKEYEER